MRCPKFLDVSGFDSLANSIDIKLSDDGVSSLGEICEFLAIQILEGAQSINDGEFVNLEAIIYSAKSLGIKLELDSQGTTVIKAEI